MIDKDSATKIKENKWLQGLFLPDKLISEGTIKSPDGVAHFHNDSYFLVVTQSCDLLHNNFDNEPLCELYEFCKVAKIDPKYQHGYHPRIFHINISVNDHITACETRSKSKFFIPREFLKSIRPRTDVSITPKDLSEFLIWLSNRYVRPAFPNAFHDRLDPCKKSIASLIKDSHKCIRQILIRISPDEEVDVATNYLIEIILVAFDQAFLSSRKELEVFRGRFETEIISCSGIGQCDVKILPESRVSIKLLDYFLLWHDYDYLSGDE